MRNFFCEMSTCDEQTKHASKNCGIVYLNHVLPNQWFVSLRVIDQPSSDLS